MLTEAAYNGFNIVHAGNEGRKYSADSGFLSISVFLLTRFLAVVLPTYACAGTRAAMHCEFVYYSVNTMKGKGGKLKCNEITPRRHVDTHLH